MRRFEDAERRIEYLEVNETSSTYAAFGTYEWRVQEAELRVLRTDFQTAGEGQRGAFWESERGQNLLVSVGVKPVRLLANEQFLLSIITALAAVRVLRDCGADQLSIKWPNDLYWHNRKIGGILIKHNYAGERLSESIIGVGLNINQKKFLSSAPNPVSLCHIIGQDTDVRAVCQAFVHHFQTYYRAITAADSLNISAHLHLQYEDLLFRSQGFHRYEDETGQFDALIDCVDELGRLHLHKADGTRQAYAFKEVRHVLDAPIPLPQP